MRRTPVQRGLLAAVLLCLPLAAGAQTGYYGEDDLWPVDEFPAIRIKVGRGELVTLPSDVERVALADDTLARPQVISNREVLLTGLVPGHTTVFVWLVEGDRLKFPLEVVADLDLELVQRMLADLDPGIVVEPSGDGTAVVVRGEVTDRRIAREAKARASSLLEGRAKVLDLLRYPGYTITSAEMLEQRLAAALVEIDSRIKVRRLQVGDVPDPAADSFVLEGRVRDIHSLKRAVTLAERQLGGTGSELKAAGEETLRFQRTRGFVGSIGGGGGTGSGAFLQGSEPPPAGLSSKIARGLVVTSASGRVVSFLEVDLLPQVLVSIRVVEVDRTRAKKVGINYRFDNEHLSIGSYLSPQVNTLPSATQGPVSNAQARAPRRRVVRSGPSIGDVAGANLVGAFVDKASSVIAAIDFLEDQALARSVAEPNVLTLSGEPATVVVGGEVPIPTSTVNQVAAVQGFFFQDFGVRLDIRPTVVADQLIALEVAPSIVRRSIAIGVGDVPGFSVQSVQTTARVQAGESLVLGGLLSFEEGLEERKLPGFGWLPGLGRWRRKSREERELLFLISPRIVETPRSEEPSAPVQMTDLDEVTLPDLEWEEGRGRWRDDFEPKEARPDGVPASFLEEPYEEPVPESEESAGAEPVEGGEGEAEPAEGDEEDAEAEEPGADGVRAPAAVPDLRTVDAYPCLNLRPTQGTWNRPQDCLSTGTRLEVLQEREGWARVRLEDGWEGWVATRYLVPIPDPDAATLSRLTAERDLLIEKLEAMESGDEELEALLDSLQEEIDRLDEAEPPR